jgi:hypothetical protein
MQEHVPEESGESNLIDLDPPPNERSAHSASNRVGSAQISSESPSSSSEDDSQTRKNIFMEMEEEDLERKFKLEVERRVAIEMERRRTLQSASPSPTRVGGMPQGTPKSKLIEKMPEIENSFRQSKGIILTYLYFYFCVFIHRILFVVQSFFYFFYFLL